MQDLVADYWWVPLFTVPALALAFQRIAVDAKLVDSLSASIRRKLTTFDYSFAGHWVVTATTRDGRRFSRVVISNRFQLRPQGSQRLKLRDIVDVAWEGIVGLAVGPVVQLSDSSPHDV